MAVRLVLAITPDREVRLMRQPREQFERVASLRRIHLRAVLPAERRPLRRRRRLLSELHRLDARREIREPDVVPIPRRELGLRHAARRPPDGADAQALVRRPRSPEAHDADRHEFLIWTTAIFTKRGSMRHLRLS